MRHRVGSFIRFPFLGFCVVPLAGVLALAGCGTLSQEKEEQIGHAVQREVRQSHQLMRDRIIVNYVRQMGDDLVAASEPTDFEIRFYVVEDEDINAFVIPGGAIYVTTGTILAAENAAQLAGVIAHEIGHVTERHFAENYRSNRNTGLAVNVVGLAAAVLTGSPLIANSANLASSVAAAAYTTSYGREAEREADRRRRGARPGGLRSIPIHPLLRDPAGPALERLLRAPVPSQPPGRGGKNGTGEVPDPRDGDVSGAPHG